MKKKQIYVQNNFQIYTWEMFEQLTQSIKRRERNVTFDFGKIYAYNPRKKQIIFPKKEKYSNYDVLAIYHELGHYHDDLNNRKIFKHMMVSCVNRLLVTPSLLVVFFCVYSFDFNSMLLIVFSLFAILAMILGIHRLYFIAHYEISANKDALTKMKTSCEQIEYRMIRKIAFYATLSQGIFVLFCINFLLVLICMIF